MISVQAVPVGEQSSGHKHGGGYGGHFLHTLPISIREPEERFAVPMSFTLVEMTVPLSHGSAARVLDISVAMPTAYIHSSTQCFFLRPSQ